MKLNFFCQLQSMSLCIQTSYDFLTYDPSRKESINTSDAKKIVCGTYGSKYLWIGTHHNIGHLPHIIPTKMICCCLARNFYCCWCCRLLSIDWGPDYDKNDVNVGWEYLQILYCILDNYVHKRYRRILNKRNIIFFFYYGLQNGLIW